MNNEAMYVASGIGALLIVLGFAALLTQRIYLDAKTRAPIELEVPMFGKMKANYPALVLVFLGCVMTVYGVSKSRPNTTRWLIEGHLSSPARNIDWQAGKLSIFPTDIDIDLDPHTAKFKIELPIENGRTFEDRIQRLDYSNISGNLQIVPRAEMVLYSQGKASKLTSYTENTRTYEAALISMPPPNQD